jgi:hypothetical protein
MLYRAPAESVDVLSVSPSFQLNIDGSNVACAITREALNDLGYHHGYRGAVGEVMRALGSEIERLVRAKSRAGRFEENHGLVIRTTDLLRFGFNCGAQPSLDDSNTAAHRASTSE